MEKKNSIKLTDDSLTNIKLMLPLLNDKAREKFADMMYGYYISELYSVGKEEMLCKLLENNKNKKIK